MRLADVPWSYTDRQDGQQFAVVQTAEGTELRIWMPGSWGCEVEIGLGGPHEFLTSLEAQCRLIELGARPLDGIT